MPKDNKYYRWMPVEFHSQKYPVVMHKWHNTESELYAILASLDRNYYRIAHRTDTIIRSDCNPVIILLQNNNTKTMNGKLYRYKDRLAHHTFILSHFPGRLNFIADYFSREFNSLKTVKQIPFIISNDLHLKGHQPSDNIYITNPDTLNTCPEIKPPELDITIDFTSPTVPIVPLSHTNAPSCNICGLRLTRETLEPYLHQHDGRCHNKSCHKKLHSQDSIWVCLNTDKHHELKYFCDACSFIPNIYHADSPRPTYTTQDLYHKNKFIHTLLHDSHPKVLKQILPQHKLVKRALLLSTSDEIIHSLHFSMHSDTIEEYAYPILTKSQIARLPKVKRRNVYEDAQCDCGLEIHPYVLKHVYEHTDHTYGKCDKCGNNMPGRAVTYHCFSESHSRLDPETHELINGFDICKDCVDKQHKIPSQPKEFLSDSEDDEKSTELINITPQHPSQSPQLAQSQPSIPPSPEKPSTLSQDSPIQHQRKPPKVVNRTPSQHSLSDHERSFDDNNETPPPQLHRSPSHTSSIFTDEHSSTPSIHVPSDAPPLRPNKKKKKEDKEELEEEQKSIDFDNLPDTQEPLSPDPIIDDVFPFNNRFTDIKDYPFTKDVINHRTWQINSTIIRDHMKDDPLANIILHYLEYGDIIEQDLSPQFRSFLTRGHFRLSRRKLIIYSTFDKYNITSARRAHNKYNRIYIPLKLRQTLLARYHDRFIHQGINKMYQSVSMSFYWPRMKDDIEEFVNNCLTCQKCKPNFHPHNVMFGTLQTFAPNQRVSLDFAGPFKPTAEGFCYALIMVDNFDMWCELVPLKTCSTFDVLKSITSRWLYQHGFPTGFHADQGSGFTSDLMDASKEVFGYNLTFSTPYNPYGNSIVEKFVGKAKEKIRLLTEAQKTEETYLYAENWSDMLPTIQFTLNCTELPSTQFSPWKLRKSETTPDLLQIRSGLEDLLNNINTRTHSTIVKYLEDKSTIMNSVKRIAANNIHRHYKKRYKNFVKKFTEKQRERFSNFKIGQLVLVKDSAKPSGYNNFRPRYHGPYKILAVKPNGTTLKLSYLSDPNRIIYKSIRLLKIYHKRRNPRPRIVNNPQPIIAPNVNAPNPIPPPNAPSPIVPNNLQPIINPTTAVISQPAIINPSHASPSTPSSLKSDESSDIDKPPTPIPSKDDKPPTPIPSKDDQPQL